MKDRKSAQQNAQQNAQRGAQTHAEGTYGERSQEANRARIQGDDDELRETDSQASPDTHHREGGRRIYEDRQQHDEADLRSEKNRLARDKEKRGKGPGSPGREHR
jgi:hypothetical protein